MIIFVSCECIKCPSPWFWMSRKFLLEMWEGGQTIKSTYTKEGVCIKHKCVYEGEGGSNFSHSGEYALIE